MSVFREPAAWVSAAKMNNSFVGTYLYVEGESDERFWKKFLDVKSVQICVCHGWECVLQVIRIYNSEDWKRSIGVIDRDFRSIFSTEPDINNIFCTDYHDIEIMMYHSLALRHVLISIDRGNKISNYCNGYFEKILEDVLFFTDKIGRLKLTEQKNQYGLMFKYNKGHEIQKPKYEKVLDDTGQYLGDEKLIDLVSGFSSSVLSKPFDRKQIMKTFTQECKMEYDSKQLSNGHDVSYIMPYILKRKCKIKQYDDDDFVSMLYSAYRQDDFYKTDLYNSIFNWENNRGVILVSRESGTNREHKK